MLVEIAKIRAVLTRETESVRGGAEDRVGRTFRRAAVQALIKFSINFN
jgi:hypothetical protein